LKHFISFGTNKKIALENGQTSAKVWVAKFKACMNERKGNLL